MRPDEPQPELQVGIGDAVTGLKRSSGGQRQVTGDETFGLQQVDATRHGALGQPASGARDGGERDGARADLAQNELGLGLGGEPGCVRRHAVVCEAIFAGAARAQSMSAAVRTRDGIMFRLAVPGRHPCAVFWSSTGPRIEAVFPHR